MPKTPAITSYAAFLSGNREGQNASQATLAVQASLDAGASMGEVFEVMLQGGAGTSSFPDLNRQSQAARPD